MRTCSSACDPFPSGALKKNTDLKLPDKTISNIEVELEPRQAEIYAQFRDDLSAIVVQGGRPMLDDAEGLLKRLLRLVQVASDPAWWTSPTVQSRESCRSSRACCTRRSTSARRRLSGRRSRQCRPAGQHFEDLGVGLVHGGVPMIRRNEAITSFKTDPDCRVLIATPGAAKEGLTLTVANHAIFYDRTFSLDDYLQSQDRIHRISQEKPCHVRNLIASDTVDGWVDALLTAKHLAAQLGQGDINRAEYEERADYAFGEMVRDVLRLNEDDAQ